MSPSVTRPHSLNLDHQLSNECKARTPSAMKALGKLMMGKPGLVSLAGGMPHPSLFPLTNAKFTIPHPSGLGDVGPWAAGTAEKKEFELVKNGQPGSCVIDLARGMQYGLSNGFEELIDPIAELMRLVHNHPISDSSVVLTLGCTDGVAKTWALFCEKGDNVLCEEFSFSNSLNSGRAKGITFHGVEVDGLGMIPESLDRIMTNWDVALKGKRPSLIYTIPVGQNPTGSVPSPERYDEIYALAQKHDMIIMEDDPYFFLQFQPYTADLVERKQRHDACVLPPPVRDPLDDDLAGVVEASNRYAGIKSFLSRDVDGRVVRLDSFSKIMFPGSRTGWVTCNASFAERYMRVGETQTQVPNGVGQSILASYLSPHGWGVSGFLRWVFGVRVEYQRKRDFFLDNLNRYVDPTLATTVPALGGMFQWIEIHLHKHPRFTTLTPAPLEGPATNTVELIQELFDFFLERQLLVLPGALFATHVPGIPNVEGVQNIGDRSNYVRATFAGNTEQIQQALAIFGSALNEFFEQ